MKNRINKRTLWLAAAALLLVGSVSIQSAMAYFTTYVTAKGGYEVSFDTTTTITEEDVVNLVKTVKVENTGKTPCYVRVKYFVGTELFGLTPDPENPPADAGWAKKNPDDGYWYYTGILQPDEITKGLGMKVVAKDSNKDMFATEGDFSYVYDFDVVVIQEMVPVQADAKGNVLQPTDAAVDWTRSITDINGEGAGE